LYIYKETLVYRLVFTPTLTERFHGTSRQPYWCSENNEMAAILVSQTNPVGVQLIFFFFLTLSFVKSELINMTRAWDKEKNLSPRLAVYHRVVMHLWCLEST